jgi:hypothetical protein
LTRVVPLHSLFLISMLPACRRSHSFDVTSWSIDWWLCLKTTVLFDTHTGEVLPTKTAALQFCCVVVASFLPRAVISGRVGNSRLNLLLSLGCRNTTNNQPSYYFTSNDLTTSLSTYLSRFGIESKFHMSYGSRFYVIFCHALGLVWFGLD